MIIKKRKVLEKLKTLAWDNLSRESRCFHIAFIFKGNNILSIGVNSKKTHPQIKKYRYQDFSRLHAELAAAIKFGKTDCRKYSLAVLRIDRNGEFNQSKPCECCSNMLNQLNFKNVYFTNGEGEWESN